MLSLPPWADEFDRMVTLTVSAETSASGGSKIRRDDQIVGGSVVEAAEMRHYQRMATLIGVLPHVTASYILTAGPSPDDAPLISSATLKADIWIPVYFRLDFGLGFHLEASIANDITISMLMRPASAPGRIGAQQENEGASVVHVRRPRLLP